MMMMIITTMMNWDGWVGNASEDGTQEIAAETHNTVQFINQRSSRQYSIQNHILTPLNPRKESSSTHKLQFTTHMLTTLQSTYRDGVKKKISFSLSLVGEFPP